MKIKRSQLKNYIKSIVREAIAEREGIVNENSQIPSGKLAHLNPKIATNDKNKKFGTSSGKLPPPIKKVKEAGLTSEDENDHAYDEKEEILLIKVMKLIADKLSAMHGDQEIVPKAQVGEPEEPESPETPEPFPSDDLNGDDSLGNFDGGSNFDTEPNDDNNDDDDEEGEEKEPDVNEAKVQKRSYVTVKDTPMDPENVRDPEVPMSECQHKKYKLRDDGGYKCEACGKRKK